MPQGILHQGPQHAQTQQTRRTKQTRPWAPKRLSPMLSPRAEAHAPLMSLRRHVMAPPPPPPHMSSLALHVLSRHKDRTFSCSMVQNLGQRRNIGLRETSANPRRCPRGEKRSLMTSSSIKRRPRRRRRRRSRSKPRGPREMPSLPNCENKGRRHEQRLVRRERKKFFCG